ncbi:hypothetical protein RJT34_19450 [Clitoria ternatea]|uniref:Transmembrane protein n=1 Tax=Clitoria ternatea TaxID=43366 RepID=A0AAN9IR82_CLITE
MVFTMVKGWLADDDEKERGPHVILFLFFVLWSICTSGIMGKSERRVFGFSDNDDDCGLKLEVDDVMVLELVGFGVEEGCSEWVPCMRLLRSDSDGSDIIGKLGHFLNKNQQYPLL